MPTIGGIECEELDGSGVLDFARDSGYSGQRLLTCDWDDAETVIAALAGGVQEFGSEWRHTPPAKWPTKPIYVTAVNRVGLGVVRSSDADGFPTYDRAKLDVSYTTLPYDTEETEGGETTFQEEQLDFGGQFLTVPKETFYIDGVSPKVWVDENVGKVVPHVDWTLVRYNVPVIPRSAIRTCLGKINDSTFQGASPNLVLFYGAACRRKITSEGVQPWRVTLKLKERGESWLKVFTEGEWKLVKCDKRGGGTAYMYEEEDLDLLLA